MMAGVSQPVHSTTKEKLLAWLHGTLYRPNAAAFLSAVFLTLITYGAGLVFKLPIDLSIYAGWQLSLGPVVLVLAFWAVCIASLIRNRPARPTRFIIDRILHVWDVPHLLGRGLPVFFLLGFPLSGFTSYKASFSSIVPYYADPYLADFDRWLHGTDPWRLLQPLVGYPFVTYGLNVLYLLWFTYMFAVLAVSIFVVRDTQLRSRYLSAYFLSWAVVGGLFATLFSSVGPCFYLDFLGSDRFGELMQYLRHANESYSVGALTGQSYLLEQYKLSEAGLGAGISAFPSMHVAIVVLNALFISKLNRFAGYLAWIYAILILIGSVHLAWHYAVDGYASAILVYAVWIFSGWLTKTILNNPLSVRQMRAVFQEP